METSTLVPTIIHYAVLLVVLVIATIAAVNSLVVTKQSTVKIIERFGKFISIRKPGISFKMPFVDKVAYIQSLRMGQIEVKVETITSDKVTVHMKVAVQYLVQDTDQAIKDSIYKLTNFEAQIQSYVFNEIRSEVPKKTLDDVYSSKQDIEDAVKNQLSEAIAKYGYIIQNALVIDIDPDSKVKEAMNKINAATRDKKAAEEEGEAAKIRMIKSAEAEAASKELQGKGIAAQRNAIIEGFKNSIKDFSEGANIDTKEVMKFVELTQYYDTLTTMSKHNNNVIFMPHSSSGGMSTEMLAANIGKEKYEGINAPKQESSTATA